MRRFIKYIFSVLCRNCTVLVGQQANATDPNAPVVQPTPAPTPATPATPPPSANEGGAAPPAAAPPAGGDPAAAGTR